MFSGIVEDLGKVSAIDHGEPTRISIRTKFDLGDTKIGDSIAINGVCLTVVKKTNAEVDFELSLETVRRTNLFRLKVGESVNVERSLQVGSRIHGHFVFGHVDGIAELIEYVSEGASFKLTFKTPPELSRYIVEKGSISLNGVSLTVGKVNTNVFSVYIIPHTASHTTLGDLEIGQMVNVEVDMLARYVLNQANGN